MKSKYIILTSLGTALLLALGFVNSNSEKSSIQEVKDLVSTAYLNGAFNDLDTRAMKAGFHPDFAIFSASGEKINKYPISEWIEGIEKRKKDPDFDPTTQIYEYEIPSIDVTGGSAAVKVELFHQGKHIYTDYLSLLKFESGWKIVAKVYHHHKAD